ncbi:DUF11 domain-containing protein [Clostridium butyricum]|uniref:DUF11 domain-containing protein n=1 Tax=Clostridium butyricum TaxID=1492 RepID=UPI0028FD40B1|nr:DUF11 domain-containing protein [Clostridium butyricum]MDU0324524.1 DUF11 domain-containing protein [Clostridium butyricum]
MINLIVINQGRVNYRYKVSEEGPVIYDTILSNRVVTPILDKNLSVRKEVDKVIASISDVLTYTINITNISNKTVENICLKDKIPKETLFIKDSVKINGITQYGATTEKLHIGNLKCHEKADVTFKVAIYEDEYIDSINNKGFICYDYIYNVEEKPIEMCLSTNKVETYIMYNIFKQTSVSSNITICLRPCEKIKICEINCYPKTINSKILKTITGNKLLIIWEIKYCMHYLRYFINYQYDICNVNYKENFSTLLDIPYGYDYSSDEGFKIINEKCSYHYLLGENRLIIYNSILIIANNF